MTALAPFSLAQIFSSREPEGIHGVGLGCLCMATTEEINESARVFGTRVAARECYEVFMRGYRHGASGSAQCPYALAHTRLAEHYKAGYDTARADHGAASNSASERYGYTPSPFRSGSEEVA